MKKKRISMTTNQKNMFFKQQKISSTNPPTSTTTTKSAAKQRNGTADSDANRSVGESWEPFCVKRDTKPELGVCLNVGGKLFRTTMETLQNFPETRLAKLVSQVGADRDTGCLEICFDRNPKLVNNVLDFYRTGQLHVPQNMCSAAVERELRFWGLPTQLIGACCWRQFQADTESARIVQHIDEHLQDPFREKAEARSSASTRVWLTMENRNYSTLAKVWNAVYFVLVAFSVLNFLLQTSPTNRSFKAGVTTALSRANLTVADLGLSPEELFFATDPAPWLRHTELVCYLFFFLDLTVRLAVCPRRACFFLQFKNGLDLFLLVHFVVVRLVDNLWDPADQPVQQTGRYALIVLYSMLLLRVMRVLILAKDIAAMQVLWLSAKASAPDLLMLAACVLSFVTLFGGAAFLAESISGLHTFPSIPEGMWWAVVTMTTVGYGDVYPESVAGQMVGSVCALSGVVILAMPISILASRFTAYHGNMGPRQHRDDVTHFLGRHPRFRHRSCCHGNGGEDDRDPSGGRGEALGSPTSAGDKDESERVCGRGWSGDEGVEVSDLDDLTSPQPRSSRKPKVSQVYPA